MNYNTIEKAKKNYSKYKENYEKLQEEMNFYFITISKCSLDDKEKNRSWLVIHEKSRIALGEVEEMKEELTNSSLSLGEIIFQEEKDSLLEDYRNLINSLEELKSEISQQLKKKTISITPFKQKQTKADSCYFCNVSLIGIFSYKLEKGEREVLGIKIAEGALFCSVECLRSYSTEYKDKIKLLESEEEEIKWKIEENDKLMNKLQKRMTLLQECLNYLTREEKKILRESEIGHLKEEKLNFWQRFKKWFSSKSSLSLEDINAKREKINKKLEECKKRIQDVTFDKLINSQFYKAKRNLLSGEYPKKKKTKNKKTRTRNFKE